MEKIELCILIPAKDEELSISSTVRKIHAHLVDKIAFNILIVNDHSLDNTLKELDKLSNELSNVRYVNNISSGGVGNAIKYGLLSWKGNVLAICMADDSDSPEDVLRSFNLLVTKRYNCVFGSRFIQGSSVNNYPPIKLFLNRLFNNIVRITTRYPFNDFTNIFKMYSREALYLIGTPESASFDIGLEMSLKAYSKRLKIGIIAISWNQRKLGSSKLNLTKNIKRYFGTLMKHIANEW